MLLLESLYQAHYVSECRVAWNGKADHLIDRYHTGLFVVLTCLDFCLSLSTAFFDATSTSLSKYGLVDRIAATGRAEDPLAEDHLSFHIC